MQRARVGAAERRSMRGFSFSYWPLRTASVMKSISIKNASEDAFVVGAPKSVAVREQKSLL